MNSADQDECAKCGAHWTSPVDISTETRRAVAALVREGSPLNAVKQLRESGGLSLRDAKAVMQHITRSSGNCHRCNTSLGGANVCGKCGSVNYDW